jgi:hypothetical protein
MTGGRVAARGWNRILGAVPRGRKRWALVALLGWWLSPLTAWNDAFTNIPLSIAVVYLLRAAGMKVDPKIAAVVVYILTNVLGLLLLWLALGKITSGRPGHQRPVSVLRIAARVSFYACLVFLTVWALERMVAGL